MSLSRAGKAAAGNSSCLPFASNTRRSRPAWHFSLALITYAAEDRNVRRVFVCAVLGFAAQCGPAAAHTQILPLLAGLILFTALGGACTRQARDAGPARLVQRARLAM